MNDYGPNTTAEMSDYLSDEMIAAGRDRVSTKEHADHRYAVHSRRFMTKQLHTPSGSRPSNV